MAGEGFAVDEDFLDVKDQRVFSTLPNLEDKQPGSAWSVQYAPGRPE